MRARRNFEYYYSRIRSSCFRDCHKQILLYSNEVRVQRYAQPVPDHQTRHSPHTIHFLWSSADHHLQSHFFPNSQVRVDSPWHLPCVCLHFNLPVCLRTTTPCVYWQTWGFRRSDQAWLPIPPYYHLPLPFSIPQRTTCHSFPLVRPNHLCDFDFVGVPEREGEVTNPYTQGIFWFDCLLQLGRLALGVCWAFQNVWRIQQ